MKPRTYISLLIFALFLLAQGGRASLAYMCHCDTKSTQHVCCHNCSEHVDCDFHQSTLKSDCCAHHSDDVDIYTSTLSVHEKRHTVAVFDLPFAAVATAATTLLKDKTSEVIYLKQTPLDSSPEFVVRALRAPPVLV